MTKKILFVCLGNICRSPAAEGIMKHKIAEAGLEDQIACDSAGTSAYHTNERADARMRAHAQDRGYNLESLARQFTKSDFSAFDYILTMDNSNWENVQGLDPDGVHKQKVHKFVSFCSKHNVDKVPDPYYDGEDGFRLVMDILEDGCEGLLEKLKGEIDGSGK